jgi:hypothetical protein
VVNTVFDHTSVLSTLVNRFGLPQGRLGLRQVQAPDVSVALNRQAPRQDFPPINPPPDWDPSLEARIATSTRALLHARNKPLNHMQRRIVLGAAHRMNVSSGRIYEASQVNTALEADAFLMKLEAEFHLKKYL